MIDNDTIKYDLEFLRESVSEIRGEKKSLEKDLKFKIDRIRTLQWKIDLWKESLIVLDQFTVRFLETITKEYSTLIKSALKLLGEDYDFKIVFDTEKKKPTCQFFIKTKNLPKWIEPKGSNGEGIIDVIGLAAMLITVKLIGGINFIALDEPLAQLSRIGYSNKMADFIRSCSDTGLQVLISSHNARLLRLADKKFNFDRLTSAIEEE